MNRVYCAVISAAIMGCSGGTTDSGQNAQSPDEMLAEQEKLGAQQQKQRDSDNSKQDTPDQTEDEKKRGWDERQGNLELKRAELSAQSCPGAVTEKAPKGKAAVTLVFLNDGHVKTSEVAAPYTDTMVGKCVLRAMGAVIVPAFEGPEKTINWEVDLTKDVKSAEGVKADDKKGAKKPDAKKPEKAAKPAPAASPDPAAPPAE